MRLAGILDDEHKSWPIFVSTIPSLTPNLTRPPVAVVQRVVRALQGQAMRLQASLDPGEGGGEGLDGHDGCIWLHNGVGKGTAPDGRALKVQG